MSYTPDEAAEIARLTGWHLGTARPAITARCNAGRVGWFKYLARIMVTERLNHRILRCAVPASQVRRYAARVLEVL